MQPLEAAMFRLLDRRATPTPQPTPQPAPEYRVEWCGRIKVYVPIKPRGNK